MKIGTRSVLYGVHSFWSHWIFVALAWWKLYGFPRSLPLWLAFFVHDIGYLGKPNMDGIEGERHPEVGAYIMAVLCDREGSTYWHDFCLLHSRYYAKKLGKSFSQLCVADKFSFVVTPRWLYWLQSHLSGEIKEYLKNAEKQQDGSRWIGRRRQFKEWHRDLCAYMTEWVNEHKDMREDKWTSNDRHTATKSGVWQ